MTTATTYPLEPLLEAARMTPGRLARIVNASSDSMRRYAEQGLTVNRADAWATLVGLHPGNVWDDWWADE